MGMKFSLLMLYMDLFWLRNAGNNVRICSIGTDSEIFSDMEKEVVFSNNMKQFQLTLSNAISSNLFCEFQPITKIALERVCC